MLKEVATRLRQRGRSPELVVYDVFPASQVSVAVQSQRERQRQVGGLEMAFYVVRPEVPGQLGDETVLHRSGDRLQVARLEYVFDGWLGDELITSHPAFAATRALADKLIASRLTGFEMRAMEVSRSDEFRELYPSRQLPEFVEIVVTGTAGTDDMGIDAENDLVVSQQALDVITATRPLDLIVMPFSSG
jgi:hypothetical protein